MRRWVLGLLRFNNMSLNPPTDSVQEVNVLRNSFSTEYGRSDRPDIRIRDDPRVVTLSLRLHWVTIERYSLAQRADDAPRAAFFAG